MATRVETPELAARKIVAGVDCIRNGAQGPRVAGPDLEVEVRTGSLTARPNGPDSLTGRNLLAGVDDHLERWL